MMNLSAELRALFPKEPSFAEMMALRGQVYRELENRRTQRVVLREQAVFIKQHFGVGWREIIKNLVQLRLPILSAKNEWQAIQFLQQWSIPTLACLGYGISGCNPARLQSFIVTRELPPHQSLEELTKKWREQPPTVAFKRRLINEVARITRIMHEHGMNHRDFYLCHLVLENKVLENEDPAQPLGLRIIDLHRAQIRSKTPERWVIKDLAGLYFSSRDIGLTQRDLLRFMRAYRQQTVSHILNTEQDFWQKVKRRGDELYHKHTE